MKKNTKKGTAQNPKVYVNLALNERKAINHGFRPHGGRKGVSNHYPPSIHAFASERPNDFVDDVKNMVFRQLEKERERRGSPQWVDKYNRDLNHTGEQPLMVQRYLSYNKQEQMSGVLPANQKAPSRFRAERRDAESEYQQGLSLHQYLTATEMPGEAQQLVDVKHGKPTRTSLLRARYRSKSAPGPVKTKLELRDNIHHLQEQTIKREEKYKSVDVPDDLQPLTDKGETVHQFLVGARYNRAHYRDAKCFNNVGLYVSRENPQYCYLKPSINQEYLESQKSEKSGANSEVTASELNSLCHSATSSMQGFPANRQQSLQPPDEPRQAWGATGSIASAPSPTPNESRESFATTTATSVHNDHGDDCKATKQSDEGRRSALGMAHCANSTGGLPGRRVRIKSSPMQLGASGTATPPRSGAAINSCDSCILCQEGAAIKSGGGLPSHFHGRNVMSAPARRKWTHGAARGRDAGGRQDNGRFSDMKRQTGDLMLIQQYHLRILGTQMNMNHDDRAQSPSSLVHYTPRLGANGRPKTAARSSRGSSARNRNNNNNGNSSGSMDAGEGAGQESKGDGGQDNDAASTSSRISVHISTAGDGEEKTEEGEESTPDHLATGEEVEFTPRSHDVTIGTSPREWGEEKGEAKGEAQPTPRSIDSGDATREREDEERDPVGASNEEGMNEEGTNGGRSEQQVGEVSGEGDTPTEVMPGTGEVGDESCNNGLEPEAELNVEQNIEQTAETPREAADSQENDTAAAVSVQENDPVCEVDAQDTREGQESVMERVGNDLSNVELKEKSEDEMPKS